MRLTLFCDLDAQMKEITLRSIGIERDTHVFGRGVSSERGRYLCLYRQVFAVIVGVLLHIIAVSAAAANDPQLHEKHVQPSLNTDVALLMTHAESAEHKDKALSFRYARDVLGAVADNDFALQARANALLARLAMADKDIVSAGQYCQRVAAAYSRLGQVKSQISARIDCAHRFFDGKFFAEGLAQSDRAMTLAENVADVQLQARSLIVSADGLVAQHQFDVALEHYLKALALYNDGAKVKDKNLARLYDRIAQVYKNKKDFYQSVYFLKKSLPIYQKIKDQKKQAKTLDNLATAERKLGNLRQALDDVLRSLDVQKHFNEPKRRAKTLLNAGIIYRMVGGYEKSLFYVSQAHVLQSKLGDANGLAATNNETGLIYTRLQQFENARNFYLKTIELSEDKIDLEYRAAAFRELANIELAAGNYDKALAVANEAAQIYQTRQNVLKATSVSRILGDIYRAQGHAEQAIFYYQQSIDQARSIKNTWKEIIVLNLLGDMLMDRDLDKALRLLKKSEYLSQQFDDKSVLLKNYASLKKAEKARGNLVESLQYADKELALTQTIHQQNVNSGLAYMKLALDVQNKEMQLQALEKKSERDVLELKRKNDELKIAHQAKTIAELELVRKKYAGIALWVSIILLLAILLYILRCFWLSRRHHHQLGEKYNSLERVNENKDRLFSIVAHDIRSPISSVLSLCQMVRDNRYSYNESQLLDVVDKIEDSSKSTLSLLNTLLEWAASQFINAQVNPTRIKASDVCASIIEESTSAVELKSITVENLSRDTLYLCADRHMVATCLRNVLANAIKYTPPKGHIVVATRLTHDRRYVEFLVRDSGAGMDHQLATTLFSRKKQHSVKGTNGELGFGLGLSLCRDLVEKNLGHIFVNSESGKGCEFVVQFPHAS